MKAVELGATFLKQIIKYMFYRILLIFMLDSHHSHRVKLKILIVLNSMQTYYPFPPLLPKSLIMTHHYCIHFQNLQITNH